MNKFFTFILVGFFLSSMESSAFGKGRQAQIVGDFIQIRNAPDPKAPAVAVFYKNMIVDVLEKGKQKVFINGKEDFWYLVKNDQMTGWCFGPFLDFDLKNKDKGTYDAPTDLDWFFKRYGYSTWEFSKKIDITSFTLDEYRSLLCAAEQGNDIAAQALDYSLVSGFEARREAPPFPYLMKKIYSKEFVAAMMAYHWDEKPFLASEIEKYKDDESFLLLMLKKPYTAHRALEIASPRLKTDRTFIKKVLAVNGDSLGYLDDKFKDDEELALIAVENTPRAFQYLSERLKGNKKLAEQVVAKDASLYRYVSSELKADREFSLSALNKANERDVFFRDMSPALQDDLEIATLAIEKAGPYGLEYIYPMLSPRLKGDRGLALKAVSKHPYTLKYMDLPFKDDDEIVLLALKVVMNVTDQTCVTDVPEEGEDAKSLSKEECEIKMRTELLAFASERLKQKYADYRPE